MMSNIENKLERSENREAIKQENSVTTKSKRIFQSRMLVQRGIPQRKSGAKKQKHRLPSSRWLHVTSFPPDIWQKRVLTEATRITPIPQFKLLLTHLSNKDPSCFPSAIFQFKTCAE